MTTPDRRRLVLSSLAVLLVFGILAAVFWRPEPSQGGMASRPARPGVPHKEVAGRGSLKTSRPSAAGLVSALEQKVGAALRDSAVGKGRRLGAFRLVEYPLGKPATDGEPAEAFVSVPSSGDNVAVEPNQPGGRLGAAPFLSLHQSIP